MGQHTSWPSVALLCALCLVLARAQDFDSPGYKGPADDGAAISTGNGGDEADSLVQAMDEMSAGDADFGEGDSDLMDFGAAVGNKAPSISSVGGASVSSSFNFTKAAEMRKAAMERSLANSTAGAPKQAPQPGVKSGTPAVAAAKAGAQIPAQTKPEAALVSNPLAATGTFTGTQAGAAIRAKPGAQTGAAGAGAVPAGGADIGAQAGTVGAGAVLASGANPGAQPGLARGASLPAAGGVATAGPGTVPGQPGVADLANNAAATNAQVAAKLAALGKPAAVPGGRPGELTDNSLRDQRTVREASVLPPSVKDPRMELGADANTSQVAPTNFKGAQHIAKRQARHYKSLPGTISAECRARLTAVVSNGMGQFYEAGSLSELLGNVSALKTQHAEQQMNEVLASILSGTATTYTDFHLTHTTNNYDVCKQSASMESLRACLIQNKKQLRHSEIMWFDESFLAVLLQRLGDVRSMFGFGSGRGDFERWFYEQGVGYTYGLEPGFLGGLGFYAPGWEYREGPVQLTSLLPNASGVQELEEFRCYMTGDAHHRVDLVQSFETFEEIPREAHCEIINVLAGMASRWIAVTMGQLGQGGGHHIANRHKEDFLSEWTQRGLVYRGDIAASIKDDCYMCQLHYLRYNLLIFEVDPSRMTPVDCGVESPAEWAPYENFVEQLVYLPNGSTSPSRLHEKQYNDWQYVLRLKAG